MGILNNAPRKNNYSLLALIFKANIFCSLYLTKFININVEFFFCSTRHHLANRKFIYSCEMVRTKLNFDEFLALLDIYVLNKRQVIHLMEKYCYCIILHLLIAPLTLILLFAFYY